MDTRFSHLVLEPNQYLSTPFLWSFEVIESLSTPLMPYGGGGSSGVAPLILNLGGGGEWSTLLPGRCTPGQEPW
jgi:hypothetical protein